MDTQRLILFFIFSFSLLLLWEAWQKETRPKPVSGEVSSPVAPAAGPGTTPAPATQAATPTPSVPASPGAASVPSAAAAGAASGERIRVRTDLVLAEIDTLGGDVVMLELLRHKDSVDQRRNLLLFGPEHRYFAQSGLIGEGLPTHKTLYTSQLRSAELQPGQDKLEIRLSAPEANGVRVTKVLRFQRGSYLIDVTYEIESAGALSTHAYFQLSRDGKAPAGDSAMMYMYTGPAVYTEAEKFQKVTFGDIDKNRTPYPKTTDNGWVAMIQHYFVAALVPPEKTPREYYTRRLADNYYAAGVILPVVVAPGTTTRLSVPIYAGPQEQSKLKTIAPGLDLVVDYGWLTIIAAPLFWVLDMFHGWTGNWGIAIILLTVVIKLIFFPLSAASYRSMAKMKLVTPRLMKIRETYADDRMKMNQAMMELYKTEKINPLGGCLPILVQIPVFISLYWVLAAAVELRHAPFYGWITDLSAIDPWFVLPTLMMLSMVVQTRMNPTPPDPVQAKVMMIMPFAFGVMFYFFPAGLVLYWLVNNLLSIAQQWQIQRMVEGEKAAAKR